MLFVVALVVAVVAFLAVRRLTLDSDDPARAAAARAARTVLVAVVVLAMLVAFLQTVRIIPAGHVGVVDLFGVVAPTPLNPACAWSIRSPTSSRCRSRRRSSKRRWRFLPRRG